MASIRTAIELYDSFSAPMMNVINAVNLGVSAIYDMQSAISEPFDTASIEGARESINRATIAMQELDAAIQGTGSPEIESPPSPPPVDVPIQWQSGSFEVFTGSGIERFQQEVQSTNAMLEQLSTTQNAIARQAYNTNIFPPEAFQDLNSLAVRIDNVRNRIQTIENNPLNMGTDAANAELEMLRGQLDQAIQEQQNLNRAMDDMDVQAANNAYLRLRQTIGDTERHIRDNVDEQGRFNHEIERGTESADKLMNTIGRAVAAYATMQTVTSVLELSDQLTSTTARLDLMNDGLQTTKELQDMIFLSAERSRASYQDTADAVSKLGLMAGDAFSSNEETIAFMEQVNKQFAIAGTEASGIQAAMLQLTQAMGSGVLRGEEYNSILDQAPNIIQTISDYIEGNEEVLRSVAEEMGMTAEELAGNVKGSMKDIAGEGILSAELVKEAMFLAADDTNEKFESMPKTFAQIWTSFQNHALMAFQPVLERMNEIGNSEAFQDFVDGGMEALSVAAGLSIEIFDSLANTAGLLADNWSWLSPVIYGVVAALILYNTVAAISTGIAAAKALAEGVYAASLAMQTGATFAATAAQYGFNTALLACPLTWIILIVIAVIAVFYAAVAAMNKFSGTSVSATGIVASSFAVLGAHIINKFFVPVQNAFATVANFIQNASNDVGAAVEVAFYDMCLTVIGYFQNLAGAIETVLNKIPGVTVDITSGLDGFYSQLERAQQAVKDESGWVEYMEKWDYIDYGDAARAGYLFGEGIENTIKDFDLSSLFENNIPSPDDYNEMFGGSPWDGALDNIGSGIEDIAGNAGRIADSMDITKEELKSICDMAEQEAVNRFTTAEIHIEQTNHNTVKGGMDLDGVIEKLTESVNEAVEAAAEGVH